MIGALIVVPVAAVGARFALSRDGDERPEVDLDALHRIGAAYVAEVPDESSPAILSDLTGVPAGDPDALGAALGEPEVGADFAAGEVIELEGWLFSRTEARLAALAWVSRS